MDNALKALQEQQRLIRLEYEEEKQSFSRIAESVGIARLAARGNAWHPLRVGNSRFNSLNQRVIEVARTDSEDSDHNFDYGKPVAFFTVRHDGRVDYPFTGTVSYVDGDRMVVAIPDDADTGRLTAAASAGVMLSFDETTYRTMLDAIDRTMRAKGRLGELRDLIYSRRHAGELNLPPMRFPYLNATQEEAVNKVLAAKDVAVVHGPPGTGKTTTLVEAIHETLRRESQVLVCAQSNMAVDWISEKLTDRGINVLRIGNPSRVNDKMLSFTYERRFESHPDYPDLWSIRKAIRELRGARRGSDQWHRKMERLKARATELEIRINNSLFSQAHVVASTLTGSASRLLEGMRFPTLFIDEAAQALEAACWIAIRRAGKVVLAGDHCQLPPTVKCFEAMKAGLGKSLMERIVENHPETVSLLTMQYRMHEDIMRFSSEWFYSGAMTAAPDVRFRGILDYDTAVEWVDTSEAFPLLSPDALPEEGEGAFRETAEGETGGRLNRDEALLSLLTLRNYIERIGKERVADERIDFALISPYRAQVRLLRHMLRQTPFFKPFRSVIAIDTVDGFQGQERDVVMVSLVRSNDEGNIGFLRDLRRMNVAMTRARMKLIIIGHAPTLSRHPFYSRLLGHIEELNRH